jgi:hypothetical protein
MIITKRSISRRTVLRGMGVTLALPLLDGMVPALTALEKTAAKAVNRFGAVYVPNGMMMKDWLPDAEGTAFEFKSSMSTLVPFRDQVLVLSNLNCVPMAGRPGGTHAKASTRFLTDVSPPTSESIIDAGISVDQILAQEMGKHTQLASLELGIESSDMAGACDTGFCLPLHQHHFMAQRQHAATDRKQPARDLRAAVRLIAAVRIPRHGSPASVNSAAFWIP